MNYKDILQKYNFQWEATCELFVRRASFGRQVSVEKLYGPVFVARKDDRDCLGGGTELFHKQFQNIKEFEAAIAEL